MTEALVYNLPPLKRGDRFLFNFAYEILGDENLFALTDETLTVIGELDEQSYEDFYRFCSEHDLDPTANFIGNIRWQRVSGYYAVEFDVDPSRIYTVKKVLLVKHPDRISHYTEYALP